jgi:ribosomal protein S18 acetylase RimI-like enzyme
MDIIIRPARPEELAAVGDLTARAYEGVLPDGDTYLEHLRNAAHRAEHTELLIAANPAGDILGSVAFVIPGSVYTELARDGEGEFRMLGVDPRFQGRGAAEALVQACVGRARELGMSRIVISTGQEMHTAHRLYRRLGFERLPERDWAPVPGIDLHAYSIEL